MSHWTPEKCRMVKERCKILRVHENQWRDEVICDILLGLLISAVSDLEGRLEPRDPCLN